MAAPYFDLYNDVEGEWRWRFRAHDGRILAESRESFATEEDCKAAIENLRREAPNAPVR